MKSQKLDFFIHQLVQYKLFPGLVLKDNKILEKKKDKFLCKCVPDDKRLPVFIVPYKMNKISIKIIKINMSFLSLKVGN